MRLVLDFMRLLFQKVEYYRNTTFCSIYKTTKVILNVLSKAEFNLK